MYCEGLISKKASPSPDRIESKSGIEFIGGASGTVLRELSNSSL